MKLTFERVAIVVLFVFSTYGYIASCTHDDEILASSGPDITRGTQKLSLTDAKVSFDKAHGNVQWASLYLGATSLLTGRFDNFGFDKFEFDESNAAGISFKAWVWLNTVNTSEPARDDGCLLQTFGTDASYTTQAANLAILETTSVTLSTTDKGYIVKANLTFHGATKEISCKMRYDGKTTSGTQEVLGFGLEFSMLAKTDFGISSTNVGDNVDVKCNAVFRKNP